MLLVKNGDKEAYEILIKKYMSPAKTFAYKYIHDSYITKDIVQESFADIYVQRFRFDQQYKFSTYLYTIIKNKAMNYLKKNKELPVSSFSEEAEIPLPEQKLIDLMTSETKYFKKADFRALMDSIQSLKEEKKNLLYLYDYL